MGLKRIFEVDPKRVAAMTAEKPYGLILHPAVNDGPNVYVCEASNPEDNHNLERFVEKYRID